MDTRPAADQTWSEQSPNYPNVTNQPGVTVVILAYNQRDSLLGVVEAVLQQSVPLRRVIVVDNASTDGSADAVQTRFPGVTVLRQDENRGVGAGHNAGWDAALADPACEFVWALEHDSMPAPDCLAQLLQAHAQLASQNAPPKSIVVSAFVRTTYTSADYTTWVLLDLNLNRQSYPHPAQPPCRHDYFTFNGLLLPTSLIRQVGRLDETFFFYWEDVDYSERCRAAGAEIYRIAQAELAHDWLRATRQLTLGRWRLLWGNPSSPFRVYYRHRNWVARKRRQRHQRVWNMAKVLLAYLIWSVVNLSDGPGRGRRWWARTVALRDGLQGRMGRAPYAFLAE